MYTPRHFEKACAESLAAGKILVVTGARQTGKSTLSRELISGQDQKKKLVLNLDDPFLRDRLVQTEGLLTRMIEDQAGKPLQAMKRFHLLIDEVQKSPALFEIIKNLHDSFPDRLRIILTGSSSLDIHDSVAETLAGRVRLAHLPPFTLSEAFAHLRGEDPSRDDLAGLISKLLCGRFGNEQFEAFCNRARWHKPERIRYMKERLRFPLFPEPSASPQPEQWIADYLATYLEKDIQSLASIGNVALFRQCIRQIAARTGSTIKWEHLAQEVGTSSVTFRKYVGLMEQTFTLVRLGPFTVNPVKRVIRAPKQYLIDAGLLWGLRGFEDLSLLEASGMLGAYMELVAIVEIAKWCSFEPTTPELRFWKKTKVSEVDLVVSNRGFHIPFEIKLGQKISRDWLRGLDAFEADHRPLKIEIPYRIILHMGEPERLDERTFALPLWALT